MYQYASVSKAVEDLAKRGYTEDFNLAQDCIMCDNIRLHPDDFEIKEVYRFEGQSDPADEAVVYGIESKDGLKGVLVNGYGYSAETLSGDLAKKLRLNA